MEDRAADEGVQQLDEEDKVVGVEVVQQLDEEDKVAGCEGVQQVEAVEEL